MTAALTVREEGKEPIDLDVSVLKWQAGDTLVFRCHAIVKTDVLARIKVQLEDQFPSAKVLVLSQELSVESVLRGQP